MDLRVSVSLDVTVVLVMDLIHIVVYRYTHHPSASALVGALCVLRRLTYFRYAKFSLHLTYYHYEKFSLVVREP